MDQIIYLQHISDIKNIDNTLKYLKGSIFKGKFYIWFDYIAKIKNKFYFTCTGKFTARHRSIVYILDANVINKIPTYLLSELAIEMPKDTKNIEEYRYSIGEAKDHHNVQLSRDNMEIMLNTEYLDIKPYLKKIILYSDKHLLHIRTILNKYGLNHVNVICFEPSEQCTGICQENHNQCNDSCLDKIHRMMI